MDINYSIKKRIDEWLEGPYDEETKNEIKNLIKTNSKELLENFSDTLTFGTGGIRAKMGVGTNKLNKYTIAVATQALCNYILQKKEKNPSIIIGFDNRKNSDVFAKESAKIIAANNIKAYLFKNLRPTPLLSFGCRYKKCTSAIMITASHNTKEYNGFKVYWNKGDQILPPHDKSIIEEYNKISYKDVKTLDSINHPLIEIILDEIDNAYINTLFKMPYFEKKIKDPKIKIIYSNLHGTGITLILKCLNKFGFEDVITVKEQEPTDPDFTNAPKPNPEEKEALELGIKYLKEKNGDIFISNDPDADRIGVVVNHKNTIHILSGNQIACIMLDYLCKNTKLYPNTACIKSIVTTRLFKDICKNYDIHCIDVLTGFKYIAEKINNWEKDKSFKFLFGAEESLGYLMETFVRDKDAISASLLISKIANEAKKENKTLLDLLYELYQKYGIYREKLTSISFESISGMEKMKNLMEDLRTHPMTKLANLNVEVIDDYKKGLSFDLKNDLKTPLTLPTSNVLSFWFSNENSLIIRPSGTEPKMKIYISVKQKKINNLQEDIKKCDMLLDLLINAMRSQINA